MTMTSWNHAWAETQAMFSRRICGMVPSESSIPRTAFPSAEVADSVPLPRDDTTVAHRIAFRALKGAFIERWNSWDGIKEESQTIGDLAE